MLGGGKAKVQSPACLLLRLTRRHSRQPSNGLKMLPNSSLRTCNGTFVTHSLRIILSGGWSAECIKESFQGDASHDALPCLLSLQMEHTSH